MLAVQIAYSAATFGSRDGNDTLKGCIGNDYLVGGAGDDTYIFGTGDGLDRISNRDAVSTNGRLLFGSGIKQDGP